jgi:hypothetical protein
VASTDLVKAEGYAALQIPEEDLNAIVEENLAGQKISEFDLDRIGMPAGGGTTWEVPTLEGSEAVKQLQGVIVYWKEARSFWKEKYSGANDPPDCSSPDAKTATGDPGYPVPVDENGRFICAQCPNAEFGTAIDDKGEPGPGQACKLQRQMFLLTPAALIPLVVSLPPTSVGEAKKYFLRLASAGVPYYSVVTQIALKAGQSKGGIKFSQADFTMGYRLEGEEATRIKDFAAKLRPAFEQVEVQANDVREEGGIEV